MISVPLCQLLLCHLSFPCPGPAQVYWDFTCPLYGTSTSTALFCGMFPIAGGLINVLSSQCGSPIQNCLSRSIQKRVRKAYKHTGDWGNDTVQDAALSFCPRYQQPSVSSWPPWRPRRSAVCVGAGSSAAFIPSHSACSSSKNVTKRPKSTLKTPWKLSSRSART